MDNSDDSFDSFHAINEELMFDEDFLDVLAESSSDDDNIQEVARSREGKSPNEKRDFLRAYNMVVANYFNGRDSIFNEFKFERRFRMPRSVFNRVHDRLIGIDPFVHYTDATKKPGLYPLVKLVGCFRFLAYGDSYDREDENLLIGETTMREIVKEFCPLIVKEFGPQYLNRCPSETEKKRILKRNKSRGFPGLFTSWDCKHYNWKNCPMRLAGQHQGHAEGGKKTLIMEAIADYRKYIWYCNFGDAGSLNDLNVLDKSSIVGAMLKGGR